MHKVLFESALYAVNSKNDVTLGPIQVCEVCGYTLEGEAPDTCPLCQATKDKFIAFKE
jgi:rubrerythrin